MAWILWAITGAIVGHTLGRPYGTQNIGTLWGIFLGPILGAGAWWVHNRARAPKCPECFSVVPMSATRCKSCHSEIEPIVTEVKPADLRFVKFLGLVIVVLALLGLIAWAATELADARRKSAATQREAEAIVSEVRDLAAEEDRERRLEEARQIAIDEQAARNRVQAIDQRPLTVTLPPTKESKEVEVRRKQEGAEWLAQQQAEKRRRLPKVYRTTAEACAAAVARDLAYAPEEVVRIADSQQITDHVPPDDAREDFTFRARETDIVVCRVLSGGVYETLIARDGIFPFRRATSGLLPGLSR